jgi:hypothetical protein
VLFPVRLGEVRGLVEGAQHDVIAQLSLAEREATDTPCPATIFAVSTTLVLSWPLFVVLVVICTVLVSDDVSTGSATAEPVTPRAPLPSSSHVDDLVPTLRGDQVGTEAMSSALPDNE